MLEFHIFASLISVFSFQIWLIIVLMWKLLHVFWVWILPTLDWSPVIPWFVLFFFRSSSPLHQFLYSILELCLQISGLELHLSQIRIGFAISRFAFPAVTLLFFVSELDARPSLTDFALALFDTIRCCARFWNFMPALLTIYVGFCKLFMLFVCGLFWNL